jgi:hypothetical protein
MSGPTPTGEAEAERIFGLLLFDAEEALARGNAEKALVLASRAARERPESLIARSLFERTRREMTRGKRRERLEARVAEARGRIDGGDFAGAEKIVATVLKLLPDHAAALELFGVLKERRLAGGSAEAEAERELAGMMHARARRAAEQARAAIAAGWSFRAVMTVRRALAMVPDDPDLLALYTESLRQVDKTAGQRAIRRAAHARVLSAQGRMSAGEAAEAARILRAVLKEDPGNPEAREALATMEQVAATAPVRVAAQPGIITGRFTHRKEDGAAPAAAVPVPTAKAAAKAAARTPSPSPRASSPRNAPRPPARGKGAHVAWAIAGAAVALTCGVGYNVMTREAPTPVEPAPAGAEVMPSPLPLAAAPPETPSAIPAVPGGDPLLARTVAETLARYGRALESVDARLLAEARPDLGPHERRAILVRYEGSPSVATDLRVQSVVRRGSQATVSLVRTDVIAGRPEPTPPVAETLRFTREGGAWVLRPAR